MVTDEDIIAKAVWKLDKSPGEVTQVFNAWIASIAADVRSGARAEIPGVGWLQQQEGRTVFVPLEDNEAPGSNDA